LFEDRIHVLFRIAGARVEGVSRWP
jgi:hypothetical protein